MKLRIYNENKFRGAVVGSAFWHGRAYLYATKHLHSIFHATTNLHLRVARAKDNFARLTGMTADQVFLGPAEYQCRFANQTQEEWERTRKRKDYGWQHAHKTFLVTHPCGKEEVIKSINKFCNAMRISSANAYEQLNGNRGRTHVSGFKFSRLWS